MLLCVTRRVLCEFTLVIGSIESFGRGATDSCSGKKGSRSHDSEHIFHVSDFNSDAFPSILRIFHARSPKRKKMENKLIKKFSVLRRPSRTRRMRNLNFSLCGFKSNQPVNKSFLPRLSSLPSYSMLRFSSLSSFSLYLLMR